MSLSWPLGGSRTTPVLHGGKVPFHNWMFDARRTLWPSCGRTSFRMGCLFLQWETCCTFPPQWNHQWLPFKKREPPEVSGVCSQPTCQTWRPQNHFTFPSCGLWLSATLAVVLSLRWQAIKRFPDAAECQQVAIETAIRSSWPRTHSLARTPCPRASAARPASSAPRYVSMVHVDGGVRNIWGALREWLHYPRCPAAVALRCARGPAAASTVDSLAPSRDWSMMYSCHLLMSHSGLACSQVLPSRSAVTLRMEFMAGYTTRKALWSVEILGPEKPWCPKV